MHTQLTDLASIEQILQEMTLAEKARLVTGGSPFHSEAMPEYGIPAIFMLDSCGGINSLEFAGDLSYRKIAADAEAAGTPIERETLRDMGGLLIGFSALQKAAAEKAKNGEISTPPENGCYPTGILLGATWNPEALEACGRALAREMGSKGIDMMLDRDGNVHFVGRRKEIIIRGGENIFPGEIESCIRTDKRVLDVKVIGVPDAHYGEVVCACVVTAPMETISPDEVRAMVQRTLAYYKVPKYVLLFDELPAGGSGKVSRYLLTEAARTKLRKEVPS